MIHHLNSSSLPTTTASTVMPHELYTKSSSPTPANITPKYDHPARDIALICLQQFQQQKLASAAVRPDHLTRIVYVVLMPIVCILGSMGAAICILVFTRKQMRSSLSIYLAGLSFFDLVLLLMSLIIYPSMNLCLEEGHQGPVCHFFWRTSLATYPISLMAQTGSVWTCVAITVDRFLAVTYPLHTRAWCTSHRARTVLNCIGVVAILYKMPSIFELSLDECGRLRPTQLRNHPLYIIIYNTYGYLLLLLVIPFLVIIVLNVIVVNAVRDATVRRRHMRQLQQRKSGGNISIPGNSMTSQSGTVVALTTSESVGGISHEQKVSCNGPVTNDRSSSTYRHGGSIISSHRGSGHGYHQDKSADYDGKCTKMATVTIVAFVMFNWLAGMNNVIEAFDMDVPGNAYRIPIGNLLVCLNSATNILIFGIFGQKFRNLVRNLLCPCLEKRKYDSLSRSC
uniref:G-protein coupled receptors family 1 profile domain-containing protein n=1 Tax=Ditylenchus dipsaci TaxID=166011 RepID=A0A915DN68_9BILA